MSDNTPIIVRALEAYGARCWYDAASLLLRGVNDNRVRDAMREGDVALSEADQLAAR